MLFVARELVRKSYVSRLENKEIARRSSERKCIDDRLSASIFLYAKQALIPIHKCFIDDELQAERYVRQQIVPG
jgi:hypothetical protein